MSGPVLGMIVRPELGIEEVHAAVRAAAESLGFGLRPASSHSAPDTFACVTTPVDNAAVDNTAVDNTAVGLDLDVLWLPADDEREPGELESVHQVLGFLPSSSIRFVSYFRSRQDRDLARLVLAVLEITGGFAELDGPLGGPHGTIPPGLDRTAALARARAYVAGRPGRCLEIRYPVEDGGEPAMHHVVDAVFLRAWLEDPGFYLIN